MDAAGGDRNVGEEKEVSEPSGSAVTYGFADWKIAVASSARVALAAVVEQGEGSAIHGSPATPGTLAAVVTPYVG